MASDINSYALSIEFGLQDKATPQLDLVGQSLSKVEERMANIAGKTMTGLQTMSMQLNMTLMQMAQQYDKIQQASTAGIKPVQDTSALSASAQKKLADEGVLIKDEILQSWLDIVDVLELKADLLKQESDIIEKEEKQVESVSKGLKKWTDYIADATKAVGDYLLGLIDVWGAINEAINATEMFKNANYRLYGSQSELVGRANELAFSYGVMRKEAMEAILVLGNMKVPNEMLDKLTETAVKFNRVSGASIQTTAHWQKNLVAMGASAADIEAKMTHMAVAMRRFGLDTQDVTAIMRTQAEQAQYLRNTFGDKTAGEIQRAQIAVAAFAKELGATPEVAQAAAASLGTIEPWRLQQLGQMTGVAAAEMQTAEGQTRALAKASSDLAAKLRTTNDPMQRQALLMQAQGQYGDKLGESIFNLAQQQAASTSKIRDGAAAHDLMNKALKGHVGEVDNLNGIYAESNQTITQQLALLKNSFFAAIGAIWAKIEPAVIMLLQWVNTLIHWITTLITTVGKWIDSLGPVGPTLKYILGGIMALVVGYLILQAALGTFSIAASLATSIGGAMGTVIQSTLQGLGNGLTALAAHTTTMLTLSVLLVAMGVGAFMFAMGVSMIARHGPAGIAALFMLTVAIIAMAIGLAYAGTIAQTAAVGLLALSLVLVSAGAAAMMIALAVQILAGVATGALGSLILLGIVLIGLGIALIVMASFAMPVLPALYAVAIGLLLVAVAALIFAVALVIAINAMERVNVGLATNILVFALMLIPIALALLVAGIVLLVAGVALIIASVLLGIAGLLLLVAGMGVYFGGLMMAAGAPLLLSASWQLALGGVALLGAAIPLAIGALAIGIAGLVLVVAGIIVFIGGLLIFLGGTLLVAGAAMIYAGAAMLTPAGEMLITGTPMLIAGAFVLMGAAFVLAIAALLLFVPAVAMAAIGILLFIAGAGVYLGGLMLNAGAAMLGTGAVLLVKAAPDMMLAALAMIPAAVLLAVAGILLAIAAIPFFIGSLALFIGAIFFILAALLIAAGAALFVPAAQSLIEVGVPFMGAAAALMAAGLFLVVAGFLLAVGGLLLIVAAVVLLVAGILLYFCSGMIVAAADYLEPTGAKLMAIGLGFYMGGYGMYYGGLLMIEGVSVLRTAGGMMGELAGELEANLRPLMGVAILASFIAEPLMALGQAVYFGGMFLFFGAIWLRYAAGALSDPSASIAASLMMIAVAASAFSMAMAGLRESLAEPFSALLWAFAIGTRMAAVEMFDALDMILSRLESYGDRMAAAADKIARSFRGIMPTIPTTIWGLNLLATQPLTTTRTRDSADMFEERGRVSDERQDRRAMLSKLDDVVTNIKQLNTAVQAVAGVGEAGPLKDAVEKIASLLEEHLPEMGGGGTKLGNAMSGWMS